VCIESKNLPPRCKVLCCLHNTLTISMFPEQIDAKRKHAARQKPKQKGALPGFPGSGNGKQRAKPDAQGQTYSLPPKQQGDH